MVNGKVGLWALFWKNGGRICVYFGELTEIENVRQKEKKESRWSLELWLKAIKRRCAMVPCVGNARLSRRGGWKLQKG